MNVFKQAAGNENKLLNIIFGCTAIGILIVATFLTFSQHPLANRISLWQSDLIHDKDKYYPVLTIFLIALPPLLFLLPVKTGILKIINRKKEN
jgi:hypothetical protein